MRSNYISFPNKMVKRCVSALPSTPRTDELLKYPTETIIRLSKALRDGDVYVLEEL